LHRYYREDFYSLVGQSFSERSNNANEKGFYAGLIWNPSRKLEWVTYADYFKFPWVKYRVDGPSQCYDLFSKLTYSPKKTLNFLLQYRYRNKEENAVLEHPVNKLQHVVRHQVRIEGRYKINDAIQFRNRFDFLNYSKGPAINEQGYLLYHDVLFK